MWSLLAWPARFVFYEGFADPESVIALNLDTHKLLVSGIRRMPMWSHIPVDVPEREIVLQLSANPKNLGLNQQERRLAALIVSGVSLRELIDQSGLGVLDTYKIVHHMLDREIIVAGVVGQQRTAARAERSDRSELEKTVYNFQNIFKDIITLLRQRVKDVDVIERMNTFFDTLPEDLAAIFEGTRFGPAGELDLDRIVENASKLDQNRRTTVLRAFNELLYFTLFEMKNFLSDEDTDRIMEIIENMEIF